MKAGTIGFIFGAIIGASIAYYVLKHNFDSRTEETSVSHEETEEMPTKADTTDIPNNEEKNGERDAIQSEAKTEPTIISPEEFGEDPSYDVRTLTFWEDGTISDENEEIVTDISVIGGSGTLNHFGEYESDSVFVCNSSIKTYFEILKDYRSFPHAKDDD